MKPKTDNKSSSVNKAIKVRIKRWILEDMKVKCRKRDTGNIYLKFIHSELLYRLHNIKFDLNFLLDNPIISLNYPVDI